jgi:hypothetical protein
VSDSAPVPGAPRRRFVPLIWLGSLGALGLLALGVGGTLSGFTASITNTGNTAASGTLLMEEDGPGSVVCLSSPTGTVTTANAGTCATINKFGGSTVMVPGTAVVTPITIKNDGTVPAKTFTLTPGTCTQSNNGTVNGTDTAFCSKLDVVITSGSTTIFSGTAASLASGGVISLPAALVPVPAGGSVPISFSVTLDAANSTNADQGLAASEPLTWAFGS